MSYTTQLNLYAGIKLDKNYNNICDNVTLSSLSDYLVTTINNLRFIRNDQQSGSVQIEYPYSDIIECNYLSFINAGYSSKPFFAFIDKIIYISDKNVEIQFTIDRVSTYWDDWSSLVCMVEREHISNDYIGASRTPESIAVDNYITANVYDIDVRPDKVIALFTEAWRISDNTFVTPAEAYGYNSEAGTTVQTPFIDGMPIMLWRVAFNFTVAGINEFVAYYSHYVSAGKGNDLVSVFTYNSKAGKAVQTAVSVDKTNIIGRLGASYTPKNKKLLQYPFVKLTLTNLSGSAVEMRQEDFDTTVDIAVTATANDKGQAFAYPQNYKGLTNNTDYGLMIDNYPTFPMTVDSFQTYIAQHEVSMTLGAMGGALGTISTIATGNILGAVAGVGGLINQVGQMATAKTIPDSVVGRSSGNLINFKLDNFRYLLEFNTIPVELAKSIDSYFDKFGYCVNELKRPNIHTRPYYNYVKVSGEVGNGNVPAEIMDVINGVFNSGVTIWHDLSYVGDYSVNNSI